MNCDDGCQYAKDVGMPELSCLKCHYSCEYCGEDLTAVEQAFYGHQCEACAREFGGMR